MIEKEVAVEHYPFTVEEGKYNVRSAICQQFRKLLVDFDLPEEVALEIRSYFARYFLDAEDMFYFEEKARLLGREGANLYYHRKEHAIYQVTYDGISVARALLSRKDSLSAHLSLEGVLAIIFGCMYHDSGYVDAQEVTNYAARTPVHVAASMEAIKKEVREIGFPKFLNQEKISQLASIGIHSTHFPFDYDKRVEMREMILGLEPELRAEAHIVRLTVQLADLGGQVSRVDYYPNLVKNLRQELNGVKEGLGQQVIGEDHQLAEKCRGFVKAFVEPTVGKTAKALFKGPQNTYSQRFQELLQVA